MVLCHASRKRPRRFDRTGSRCIDENLPMSCRAYMPMMDHWIDYVKAAMVLIVLTIPGAATVDDAMGPVVVTYGKNHNNKYNNHIPASRPTLNAEIFDRNASIMSQDVFNSAVSLGHDFVETVVANSDNIPIRVATTTTSHHRKRESRTNKDQRGLSDRDSSNNVEANGVNSFRLHSRKKEHIIDHQTMEKSISSHDRLPPAILPSVLPAQIPDKLTKKSQSSQNKDPKQPLNETKQQGEQLRKEQQIGRVDRVLKQDQQQQNKERQRQQELETDFMEWCVQELGIYSILEIQTFEYYDYMKALPVEDWEDDVDRDNWLNLPAVHDYPMLSVRGLAATRDITSGETVLRIPLPALLSVAITIDQDPVLRQVMGPAARKANGWQHTFDDRDTAYLFEMPLLAVALLYHEQLGDESPMAPYIRMLKQSPIDTMPFLWTAEKLRSDASEGIRTVARSIQREIKDMYEVVMIVLIENHPQLFGPPSTFRDEVVDLSKDKGNKSTSNKNGRTANDDDDEIQIIEEDEDDMGNEWFYSYDHFQWAFAMVNSRHWQLPIADLEKRKDRNRQPAPSLDPVPKNTLLMDEQVPPADMPTDSWVQEHDGDVDDEPAPENADGGQDLREPVSHSFLAPVADLLNFGPPCTRGSYNMESHTFEIIATCDFHKGQEVTFWYSDECDHIVVAVYGFMHPIVPPCPSAEEYRARSEAYKRKSDSLEQQLHSSRVDVEYLRSELRHLQTILDDCDCRGNYDEDKVNSYFRGGSDGAGGSGHSAGRLLRRDPNTVRGSSRGGGSHDGGIVSGTGSNNFVGGRGHNGAVLRPGDIERHGIRRSWRDRNSRRHSEF